MTSFTKYYKEIEVLKSRTFSQANTRSKNIEDRMMLDSKLGYNEYSLLLVYMSTIVSMKGVEERCANFI